MNFTSKIKMAVKNLAEHKLRSLLTVISIAAGIATLVSLIIISQSMELAVSQRLGGTIDVIRVLPGHVVPGRDFVQYGVFSDETAEVVRGVRGVSATSSWIIEVARIQYEDKASLVEVMGGNSDDIREFLGASVELTEGRLVERAGEAVLSTSTLEHVNRWLGANLSLGDSFILAGESVRIVGIMAYDLAGVEVSHRILAEKEFTRQITGSDDVMLIMARVDDLSRVAEIRHDIMDAVDEFHGVSGLTSAVAAQTVVDTVGLVILIIQAVVVSIALISLLVGCIGIINVMLMSVLERTREIGIMKAIGAKNSDIIGIFLAEASVTGFIGGVLGVIGGLAISNAANVFISQFVVTNMEIIVNPAVLVGGIAAAVITGIAGGLYPADRAAKMRPAQALRCE